MSPTHDTAFPISVAEYTNDDVGGWPALAPATGRHLLDLGPDPLGETEGAFSPTLRAACQRLDSRKICKSDFFLELFALAVGSGLAAAVALFVAKELW
jgi:hypothetical protein